MDSTKGTPKPPQAGAVRQPTSHHSTTTQSLQANWSDPAAWARAAREMSGLDFLTAIAEGRMPQAPISGVLDFRLASVSRGEAVFEFRPSARYYNPIGSVHGGVACTLLDSALSCAVHSTLERGVGYTTLEVKVNFVRAVDAGTGVMRCEGRVIHAGRQVATAEARLVDAEGRLYAHAIGTCVLLGE
jgi:uncharacterized protein (TIGR00369 family)